LKLTFVSTVDLTYGELICFRVSATFLYTSDNDARSNCSYGDFFYLCSLENQVLGYIFWSIGDRNVLLEKR